ncbi:testis-specific protein 10-interacting protein [Amblyraja radiata]|uniref:testis-specific protein 10-interacting protein n=1 Tax=Amblyraja radiata TaxID=386614 RepID=UPI001403F57C|nr:testis-specific protein 10-interacting protein [Amblyraja radiata]
MTSSCVRPGPRPGLVCCPCLGPGLACCPCPYPAPGDRGRPTPGRLSTAAALYSELTCYLESMLRLAFQSGRENEEIRVQVSTVGVRGERSSDGAGLQRGGRGAPAARSSDWGSGPGLGPGSMWDGFSVDRYAPRVRSAAGPPQQHRAAEEEDWGCRPARRRPRTAPGGRKIEAGAARRGLVGPVARATGPSAPADDDAAAVASFSAPGDDAAVARVTERLSSGRRGRRRRPCPPAVAAYQRFVEQYRAALGWAAGTGQADGDSGLRHRRAASDYEVKATKLVEQRHERIRKNILEKERKEQMEKRRLVNERLKRRALERHIAARMCLHEMEWCRKDQARSRLQSLRSCSREQAAQYQADLQEMKDRVARTPFLFEQVIQNNIRSTIDRLFTRVLERQQLDEGLVLKLSAVGAATTAGRPRHVHLESPPEDCGR